MIGAERGLAIYASYSARDDLAGYVRFALDQLSRIGWRIIHVTNDRPLRPQTIDWHRTRGIELQQFPNGGYDFGLWSRVLSAEDVTGLDRLWLLNDSVVYFAPVLSQHLATAESMDAELVGLTSNDEISEHVQSFFLLLKRPALAIAVDRILAVGLLPSFHDVIFHHEIGLSRHLLQLGFRTDALYPHQSFIRPVLLSYPEIIRSGAGFVKRKLLENSFSPLERDRIVELGGSDVLDMDYRMLIRSSGTMGPGFPAEYLFTR